MKKAGKGTALKQKRTWKQEVQHNWPLYVLILPRSCWQLFFAMCRWAVWWWHSRILNPWCFRESPFVGLQQFRYIFTMPSFRTAFVNTMIISFFKIILSILVPMILSLMLNEVTKSWFKRSVQTIVFIPYFFSWAILAGMILEIFAYDGIINNTMLHLSARIHGLSGEQQIFPYHHHRFRCMEGNGL